MLASVAFGDDCVVGEILNADDRTCAHNNQTDHAEGGVVGDDDDDNDDDGGCNGRDGHHQMRSGATE